MHLPHNLGVKAAPEVHEEQPTAGRPGVKLDESALCDRLHQTFGAASQPEVSGKQVRGTCRKQRYRNSLSRAIHQLGSRSIPTYPDQRSQPPHTVELVGLSGHFGQIREDLDSESTLTQ
jgi:hypothetical protein